MREYYSGSYTPRMAPVKHDTWIEQVAAALDAETASVADYGIFIETAVVDAAADSIHITIYDRRRRSHRTYVAREVTATFTTGFDPPLTPSSAAKLIVLDVASS